VESRTRYAIGGVSTVVASVAVVCAVALTNSVAMADAAGAPIAAAPIIVPTSSAAHRAVTTTTDVDVKPVAPATETPVAEAVPAPAPIVVTGNATAHTSQPTAERAVAEAEAAGSWQPVRDWAARNRWSQERIDAWILRLEEKQAAAQARVAQQKKTQSEQSSPSEDGGRLTASESPKNSAKAVHGTERQAPKSWLGSKKDRSRDSPDRRD
jgi:hypothetical protein